MNFKNPIFEICKKESVSLVEGNARCISVKVGATIPCAAPGENYALSGAVRVEV